MRVRALSLGGTSTLTLGTGWSLTGDIAIASGSLNFTQNSDAILSNVVSGSGALIKSGTGALTLTAINRHAGGTTVTDGTLAFAGTTNALGTGALQLGGGVLRAVNGGTLGNVLLLRAGRTGTCTVATGATLTLSDGVTMVGTLRFVSVSDAGTVEWAPGSGGMVQNTDQLYIDGGTLRAGNTGINTVTSTASRTEVASGATFDLNGYAMTIAGLYGAGALLNNGSTTTIASGSFSGVLGDSQAVRATGAVTLSGASTYTGVSTGSSSVLTVASNGALGSTAGGTTVASGETLALRGAMTTAEALTLNSAGNGGLGALRADGGPAMASGAITLGSGNSVGTLMSPATSSSWLARSTSPRSRPAAPI